MQFIFGNNKSKYDLLYTDDKRETAASVLNMLKVPFAPTEAYDVYGYVPFGANSNRPLFFYCQKDAELSRSVYFLHGIYRELSPEYFFTDEYLSDLCANFIDQDTFNALREQPSGFSFSVKTNEALLQTGRNGVAISEAKLQMITHYLYQRQKVILVMDDEAYDSAYIRGLMCTIFKYLPPSLRKICSFITGMVDTAPVEFLLHVIPRSMYKKDRNACVDLSADDAGESLDSKTEWIPKILRTDDGKRKNLFDLFEIVYYGRISTFKKQTFAEYMSYMHMPSMEERYDLLMDRFVGDDRYDESIAVPPVILRYLKPLYDGGDEYKRKVIAQSTFDPYRPLDYYSDGIITIRKLYLLGDQTLEAVRAEIESHYAPAITSVNVDKLEKVCSEYERNAPNIAHLDKTIEKQFYTVLNACIRTLSVRVKKYREWTSDKRVNDFMTSVLNRNRYEILTPEKIESLIRRQLDEVHYRGSAEFKTYQIRIQTDFEKKARALLAQYNADARNQKENERFERENRFAAALFGDIQRHLDQALTSAMDEKANGKGSARDAVVDGKCPTYYPLLLQSCALDERFAEERSRYIAQHIIYSYMVDSRFFDERDEILSRLTDLENIHFIATALIAIGDDRAGLFLPYIARYGKTADDIIDLLADMVHEQDLESVQLKTVKKYIPQFSRVATSRVNQKNKPLILSEDQLNAMQEKCKALEEVDPSNKLYRAIGSMLRSFVKRMGAHHKTLRLPIILSGAAVVLLLVAGITVAVILLMGHSDDVDNGTDDTSVETTVETSAETTDETSAETTDETSPETTVDTTNDTSSGTA